MSWPVLTLALAGIDVGAVPRQDAAPAGTQAPESDAQVLERGKTAYEARCKGCHRSDGKGTMEDLDLTDGVWRHGGTPEAVEKVIREGIKGTGMRPVPSDTAGADVKALVRYVLAFSSRSSSTAPPPPPDAPPAAPAPPR